MFQELEIVKLKCDLPEHNMKAGTIGIVVMVHTQPFRAYEVELEDEESWAIVTLRDEDLLAASIDEARYLKAA